jgi:ArsR family transcriptional regulator, cadmium/lead-responsive transcriptional repressor
MPMPSLNLDADAVARGTTLFRGLADPTRLAILLELRCGERRVVDLAASVGLAQPTVSGHLACLRDCGLVTWRPVGRQSYYRLAVPRAG